MFGTRRQDGLARDGQLNIPPLNQTTRPVEPPRAILTKGPTAMSRSHTKVMSKKLRLMGEVGAG
jgi:hypothetical protein